jgi:transcriptional regulator with GAF, ATPase, and Fis domain
MEHRARVTLLPQLMEASEHALVLAATLLSPREHESLHKRPIGLSLAVIRGPDEGRRFELPHRETITGGRGSTLDVVLTDDSVSTSHFEIRLTTEGVILRDLGSTNGTWIGRSRLVDGTVSLYDGATFYAGDTKLRLDRIEVGRVARSDRSHLASMAGASSAIREIFALLDRLAPTPLTTLITGETGTGKDKVARTLHELSGRPGPFVVLDCGALPASLAESAILGHVKGAFTGANADRMGAFEAADGGTLLLDEIGELPLELQPKLLRVLDHREVERVGSNKRRFVDVRVLAATHRNLAQMVAEGRFRLDLLHRVRQVEVCIPPLRERPQDIAVLAHCFLEQTRALHGDRVAAGIDEGVLAALGRRYWEGNVRELRQTIEALAHLATGDIVTVEDLQRYAGRSRVHDAVDGSALAGWCTLPCKEATDAFMRHYLLELESRCHGDIERMCTLAGYTRKGLRGVYERLELAWPANRDDSA